MVKTIFLIIMKAFGLVISFLVTVGGLMYLFTFDLAKYLADNGPDSYYYGSFILFSLFLLICFVLSLKKVHALRQDVEKITAEASSYKLKLDNCNQKETKNEEEIPESVSRFVDGAMNLAQTITIVNKLQKDLNGIHERLITAYVLNDGKVDPADNNEYQVAKEYYLTKQHIDLAIEAYMIENKMPSNHGYFPLRKIFNHHSFQSLSDMFGKPITLRSYHRLDPKAIQDNIDKEFDSIYSILFSYGAYLKSKLSGHPV